MKTIQAAVDKAKAGDTIWVKAGVYEQEIRPRSWPRGRAYHALGMAGRPGLPRFGPARRAAGRTVETRGEDQELGSQLAAEAPRNVAVILDGKAIVTEFKDAPPRDDNVNWATYRASDRTLMVNIGGKNPAMGRRLQLARDINNVYVTEKFGYWAFKKLEFSGSAFGIALRETATWWRTATSTMNSRAEWA